MPSPAFTTERLIIRPYKPEEYMIAFRLMDRCFGDSSRVSDAPAIESYRPFVQWMSLNPEMLYKLRQPAYGDLAVTLRETGQVIGQVGYVPCLMPFDQIPELYPGVTQSGFYQTEVGLFWAIDPDFQRRGYALEAAQALINNAFEENYWNIRRIIATTEYTNTASQGVMRKLGMMLARNPSPDPPWLQIVGFLNNPRQL
jgi:ribosomal-protein-alanine N-acetyltransferase